MKRERHGKIPDSVLFDKDLSDAAKVVYGALARHSFREGLGNIGQTLIAKMIGISQSSVSRHIAELVSRKHVEITANGNGRRSGFKLLSNAFLPFEKPIAQRGHKRHHLDCARSGADSRKVLDEIFGAA